MRACPFCGSIAIINATLSTSCLSCGAEAYGKDAWNNRPLEDDAKKTIYHIGALCGHPGGTTEAVRCILDVVKEYLDKQQEEVNHAARMDG